MSLTLDLGGVINTAIEEKLAQFNLEAQVKELLGEVAKNASKVIEIKLEGSNSSKRFPLVHKQFVDLLDVIRIQGINVLLTGGAGLSKSTAVIQSAEALQLDFRTISFSNQTTKTDLLGFIDANGVYRKSGFVDAFENGHVFLGDEMDACSSNVLVLLNSAIANGIVTTPENRVIRAHENFRFVGTANTNLRGASNGFTARNKIDSATIDRFCVIEWKLDEELEEKITDNMGWVEIVRKARKTAQERLDGVEITPRASYDGSKLLRAGVDIEKVIQMTLVKAIGEDEEKVILSGITERMKKQAVVKKSEVRVEPEPEKPKAEVEVVTSEKTFQGTASAEDFEEVTDDFEW
jgi:MoxR-like ATPase